MNKKLLALAVTTALSGTIAIGTASAAQAAPLPPASSTALTSASQAVQRATAAPVSINQVLPNGSTLAGTFNLTNFTTQNGQLIANGVFNGTLTSATGTVTQLTNVATTSSIAGAPAGGGACNVLSLTLGPLHLDALGLIVDLNQVNLNITAQPGAGNLLGNLLCSVANLLNGGVPVQGLANVLNHLIGAL